MKIKKSLQAILLAILIIPVLSSCEKDPSNQILGVWDFKNITTTSTDEGTQTWVTLGKALLTDGTMEFQEDGTVIQSVPLVEDDQIGTWSILNEEQLILTIDGVSSTNTIDDLSKTDLVYTETFVNAISQEPYTTTTSWSREK